MGRFTNAFLAGWQKGKESARSRAYLRQKGRMPVRLVEPSSGRVIVLRVTESDECFAGLYIDQLKSYAETFGDEASFKVEGDIISLEFVNDDIAEIVRGCWRVN